MTQLTDKIKMYFKMVLVFVCGFCISGLIFLSHAQQPQIIIPATIASEKYKMFHCVETNEFAAIDRIENTIGYIISSGVAEIIGNTEKNNKQDGYDKAMQSSSKKGVNQAQQKVN